MQKLYTLVYDKAVAHERHFQQNKRQRMMAKVKDKFRKKATAPKNERKVENLAADRKTARKPFTNNNREPPSPCPKCKEMHWLSDCPKASDAEKVALRLKLREAS
ncbi:hypothetical protein PF002_g32158 [Phytophthora fragariae]|uniref:Uncharacterized protein n=1 Tax=Phytophthora fragariae TaxID=53985 RepID=A0A6A3V750_9STRA|nr:hypothetical protein PF002_g32158 [Phytophthora fragariae]